MPQLSVESVSKGFDSSPVVLENVDFSVSQGEFLVVLGASGSGKTTLLRIISGLEKPDQGRIHIAGRDVTDVEPKDRDVAMVFQSYALYPHMTVYDNLAFALKVRKLKRKDLDQRVKQTAGLLGLGDYLARKPKQLSGGQRQRVALGRAIVRNPALFLFDEPLSNLDAKLRARMRAELLSLHRRIGATSLYVTHDQVEAMSLADRIVILNQGRQVGPESPRTLYDNPPDVFVAGFLGSPGMNLLETTTDFTGRQARIDDSITLKTDVPLLPESRIIYGFRPEDCVLADDGEIKVEVCGLEDTGKEFIIQLLGPGNARLHCLSDQKHPLGERIGLKVKKARFFDAATGRAIRA